MKFVGSDHPMLLELLTNAFFKQECLYSALIDKNYSSAAAILFVMDRFIYWQGSSKYLLNMTDYIQRNSISTAIPPQIVIRKARIMKNEGDIQGKL